MGCFLDEVFLFEVSKMVENNLYLSTGKKLIYYI
jgi:hypothetical protein